MGSSQHHGKGDHLLIVPFLVSGSSRGWGGRRWTQGQTMVLHTLR